jgi:acyl dehydratase
MVGRTYDALPVGTVIDHPRSHRVTETGHRRFCEITDNTQPFHLDPDAGQAAGFDGILVHGLYTMTVAVGMSVPETTEETIIANLGYSQVEHPAPVAIGDELYAQTEVVDRRHTSDGDRGIVTMHIDTYRMQDPPARRSAVDPVVCRFDRTALFPL